MADPSPPSPLPGSPQANLQQLVIEQYTDKVRTKAVRFAEWRASLVRKAGRPIPHPKSYAEELTHDAMVSIWSGLRSWDPRRTPLYLRLCSIIRDRTWREIQRAQRFQHVPFDLAANDGPIDDETEIGGEQAGRRRVGRAITTDLGVNLDDALSVDAEVECSPSHFMALTRQVVDVLLPHARRDKYAAAILACWEQGFIERDEVIEVTGMSEHAYDAARQRILRLAKHLPPDLREVALDLLRRAS